MRYLELLHWLTECCKGAHKKAKPQADKGNGRDARPCYTQHVRA